ncbi:MAG: hypothetical protein O3B37_15640 [Proteobacteria bacterium]|nr:hypothetical protein [Pseudomonadota bacterium]
MRGLIIVCWFMLSLLPVTAAAQTNTDPDILCDSAPPGTVAEIPPPVAKWVILLCTQRGQTLAARVGDEVEMWLERGTAVPFQLAAAPAGVLEGSSSLTKYDLRFDRISARLAVDVQRDFLLDIWRNAYETPDIPSDLGDVFQLDTVSVYRGDVTNMFIYLRGDAPRWIVVCRDRCRSGVALDVLRGAELEARVSEQERLRR